MDPYETINVNGYHTLKHRHIMESRILHRKLKPGEEVHHINGNTFDNRIENLQVMNHLEHKRLHTKGKKYKRHLHKLTELQVKRIKLRLGMAVLPWQIGIEFSLPERTIVNIRNGELYT